MVFTECSSWGRPSRACRRTQLGAPYFNRLRRAEWCDRSGSDTTRSASHRRRKASAEFRAPARQLFPRACPGVDVQQMTTAVGAALVADFVVASSMSAPSSLSRAVYNHCRPVEALRPLEAVARERFGAIALARRGPYYSPRRSGRGVAQPG